MEQNPPYSMSDIMRLAQSPAGQQLIALLQMQNNADLQKAVSIAASGDFKSAQSLLGPLLDSPETQTLLKQLGG